MAKVSSNDKQRLLRHLDGLRDRLASDSVTITHWDCEENAEIVQVPQSDLESDLVEYGATGSRDAALAIYYVDNSKRHPRAPKGW